MLDSVTVLLLRQDREKLYQELTYINAKLQAAEQLMDIEGIDEASKQSLKLDHERLTSLFIGKVNEVKALDLYGSYYAGRLLQGVSTEITTAN